jgi:catechol 2,3-dioxygenase-like lactoylglutathione lyase family enzyme
MTRLAGPVRQIGVVVRDIDAAIRHWCDVVGFGPFRLFPDLVFEDYFYRDQPSEPPVATIAIAFSGDLQLELIQQHNVAHDGMQHVSPWFAAADEFDAADARLRASGLSCVHRGRLGETRFAYFAGPSGQAPHLEISEALHPATAAANAVLMRCARDWDGASRIASEAEIARLLQVAGA